MRRAFAASAAFVVWASCAHTPLYAQSQNDVPYRASELVQHWTLIVSQTFETMKAYTTDEYVDEVTEKLDEFLSIGAVRAVQDHATAAQLKTVDEGVKHLATAMVAAGRRQDDGSTQVTPEAFDVARRKSCPLYPFCS